MYPHYNHHNVPTWIIGASPSLHGADSRRKGSPGQLRTAEKEGPVEH